MTNTTAGMRLKMQRLSYIRCSNFL